MTAKKSNIRDILLQEGIGGSLPDKPLSYYMPKSSGSKLKTVSGKIQSEDIVRKECAKYLQDNGWVTKTIYTGGIPTGHGYAANPAKGIPDCIAFHLETKRVIWIEYKKSHGGVVSSEQKTWHQLLKTCGQEIFIINSKKLLEEKLNEGKR